MSKRKETKRDYVDIEKLGIKKVFFEDYLGMAFAGRFVMFSPRDKNRHITVEARGGKLNIHATRQTEKGKAKHRTICEIELAKVGGPMDFLAMLWPALEPCMVKDPDHLRSLGVDLIISIPDLDTVLSRLARKQGKRLTVSSKPLLRALRVCHTEFAWRSQTEIFLALNWDRKTGALKHKGVITAMDVPAGRVVLFLPYYAIKALEWEIFTYLLPAVDFARKTQKANYTTLCTQVKDLRSRVLGKSGIYAVTGRTYPRRAVVIFALPQYLRSVRQKLPKTVRGIPLYVKSI